MTTTSAAGNATSTHDGGSPASAAGTGGRIKTLVILGASGDLTGRLLLPGVARLIASGRAPGLSLVGAGSDDGCRAGGAGRRAAGQQLPPA